MKTLSVKQPYAAWLSDGTKTIELRSWRTPHRGPLLIVAGATPAAGLDVDGLSLGFACCVVDLADIRPATAADSVKARADVPDGAWAWIVANPRPVEPVPVRGQLRLFNVDDSVISIIRAL